METRKSHAMFCDAFSNTQHDFAPDFGISQLFIVPFPKCFQYNDGHYLINFYILLDIPN